MAFSVDGAIFDLKVQVSLKAFGESLAKEGTTHFVVVDSAECSTNESNDNLNESENYTPF